ncbi:uncharacterized protein LOC134288572 [Aedes albopictus]|uniref:RING-type domain-containing protein n=1 Tax=Aedes albopictus TaxID=7160 RepID=A0ABM1Y7L3_AEDAL
MTSKPDSETLAPTSAPSAPYKNDCVICMEAIVDQGKFLECAHEFHEACIDQWFAFKETCPMCRYDHAEPSNKQNTSSAVIVSGEEEAAITPRQEAVQARRRSRRQSFSSRPSTSRSRSSSIRRSRSRRR